jgi:CheY-like chemotaxis protein
MPPARLLLVDDDKALRTTLARILELNHFAVTCAADAKEAICKIASQEFDILLSDLHMPEPEDAGTVMIAMRQTHPRAVALLLSAFPEPWSAACAANLRPDDVLVKPMEVTALINAITTRLATGRVISA